MSLLTEKLPKSLCIKGKTYQIKTDFRDILRLIEMLEAPEGKEEEKALSALLWFYSGDLPEDIKQAAENLSLFFACGKKAEGALPAGGRKKGMKKAPDISFSADAPLIYAAFLTQYGIDLIEIKYLHFWAFRALFDGLEPERRLNEIRRCRSISITKQMSEGEKRYYKSMKKAYSLSPMQDETTKAIEKALLMGGDISALIQRKQTT